MHTGPPVPSSARGRRIIVGPTAAGKSALAMHLARTRGLAIVSADSRQVYQGFDIGTAKPSCADRQAIPHYGVDVVPPTDRYSAHRWAADASHWCDEAVLAGTPPLIVGGTGLYVRALVSSARPGACPSGPHTTASGRGNGAACRNTSQRCPPARQRPLCRTGWQHRWLDVGIHTVSCGGSGPRAGRPDHPPRAPDDR